MKNQRLTRLSELRSLSSLTPGVLDGALLSLMKQGLVDLDEHDYPSSLSIEARRALVVDEHIRYFNAVVRKEEVS